MLLCSHCSFIVLSDIRMLIFVLQITVNEYTYIEDLNFATAGNGGVVVKTVLPTKLQVSYMQEYNLVLADVRLIGAGIRYLYCRMFLQ